MNEIIKYITKNYAPVSIIVYGSYANHTNNEHSDFDALVISKNHKKFHDVSFVNGIQLDVFISPLEFFDSDIDCEEFVQIFDGNIVLDTNCCGEMLKRKVQEYIKSLPQKTEEELRTDIEWCKKMCLRTKRGDAEGMYRWHWVLTESLEIFCNVMKNPYFGPKKSLRWMEKYCPQAFVSYKAALEQFEEETLEKWMTILEQYFDKYEDV